LAKPSALFEGTNSYHYDHKVEYGSAHEIIEAPALRGWTAKIHPRELFYLLKYRIIWRYNSDTVGMEPGDDITHLLRRWQNGDLSAEEPLFAALYDTLHRLAIHCLQGEGAGHSLGATGLVHEAYIRFRRTEALNITDRKHFLSLAARVMRHILVDKARARRARPQFAQAIGDEPLALVRTDGEADQILAVDRALTQLSLQFPRQSQLVELRYFGGYSVEECAVMLGISEKTVQRDWQVARVRLKTAIDGIPS
jgi:RNA polymerase sigma factor (TIGR02999 family)